MCVRLSPWWACLVPLTLAIAPVSAEESRTYREFSLGSSAASVLELTGSRAADLRTVHERPALLQELEWMPRYSAGRRLPDVDPVRDMVFSFYDDQLYRIAIHYDRDRTAGLTPEDLIAALTDMYGTPRGAVSAARRGVLEPSDAVTVMAVWEHGDTLVSLYWSDYRAGFGLLVLSQGLDERARGASAAAAAEHAREAPAREAAERKKAAEDLKAAEEQTRVTNKGAFRP